jgi:hypothetical protein
MADDCFAKFTALLRRGRKRFSAHVVNEPRVREDGVEVEIGAKRTKHRARNLVTSGRLMGQGIRGMNDGNEVVFEC